MPMTEENIRKVGDVIHKDRLGTIQAVAEILGIDKELVQKILQWSILQPWDCEGVYIEGDKVNNGFNFK